MKNIERLRELTKTLSDVTHHKRRFTDYECDAGTCLGFALINEPDVAVQKAFASKDSSIKKHVHQHSLEIIIVFKGTAVYSDKDKEVKLEAGDLIAIPKNKEHSFYWPEDCWMIAVTIPADEGYPHVK